MSDAPNQGKLEQRVDSIGKDVEILKADVGILKADVRVLKADVQVLKADVHVLKADVRFLKNDHTELLRQIHDQLKPLGELRDFVKRVADNHETRIGALEERTGHQ